MTVALRYIGRKPRGQLNLLHPVEKRAYQFFTDRKFPAVQVDDGWGEKLLKMRDKIGNPAFKVEAPLSEPVVKAQKTIRCKQCDSQFTNQGLFLAHIRKEHKAK